MKALQPPAWACAFLVANIATATTPEASPNRPQPNMPAKPYRYADVALPKHFEPRWTNALDTTPLDNPTTDAGAALGRLLFYDDRLSANGGVSCGSCHVQKHAFADPRRVSVGHEGRAGDRNAMSLVNLRFARAGFFWDERAQTLEEAVSLPILSRIEMAGPNGSTVEQAIAADPQYRSYFQQAFGSEAVTRERIYKALAQFLRAMVSADSKYDRGAAKVNGVKEDFPNFTAVENQGKALFVQHCNLCHHIGEGQHLAFFDMFRSLNNGIDDDVNAADGGRGDITFNPTEVGAFKASSLRNVAVTAPYMHDGRFDTLEQVLEHYNSGVRRHPNGNAAPRLGLNADETAAVIAFLQTLTDEKFLADPRFADPWSLAEIQAVPAQPIAKRQELPTGTPAERLARGEGLAVGEALPWLKGLDLNADGALDKTEVQPLLAILTATRVGVLGERRGRGRGRPAVERNGTTNATATSGPVGDFNGDGEVDDSESRSLGSFKSLIELGDGHLRRAVRTDRFLATYVLTDDEDAAARQTLNAGREKLAARIYDLDQQTMRALEEQAGPEIVARFQTLLIDRQVAAVRVRTNRSADPGPEVARMVGEFDADGDGTWSQTEVATLAKALDRLAGGFGRAAPPGIDMAQFTRRIAAYQPGGSGTVAAESLPERLADFAEQGDRNGDGQLAPDEIEHYIRRTAFGRLMLEGVYVGGGFADALVRNADAVAELDLKPELHTSIEALFAQHARQIESEISAAKIAIFAAFREALGGKPPALAVR